MLVLERYYEEVGLAGSTDVWGSVTGEGCSLPAAALAPARVAIHHTDHGRGEDEEADLSVASGSLPVGGTHAGAVPLPRQR